MRCPLFPQLPSRRPGGARKAPQTMQPAVRKFKSMGIVPNRWWKKTWNYQPVQPGMSFEARVFQARQIPSTKCPGTKTRQKSSSRQGIAHRNHSGMALERNSRDGAIGHQWPKLQCCWCTCLAYSDVLLSFPWQIITATDGVTWFKCWKVLERRNSSDTAQLIDMKA